MEQGCLAEDIIDDVGRWRLRVLLDEIAEPAFRHAPQEPQVRQRMRLSHMRRARVEGSVARSANGGYAPSWIAE